MEKFKYEPCIRAHFFFYSYDINNQIKCLCFKQESKYTTLSTPIEEYDNYAFTFACARLITTTFERLFTDDTLTKINNQTQLTPDDIRLSPIKIKPYKLWNEAYYEYWLMKMSQSIIQCDSIDKEVVVFYEIPYLNLEVLNKNLSELNYFTSFSYFDPSISSSKELTSEVIRLFSSINIDSQIKETKKRFEEDDVDYYIVLACKKAGIDQTGYFHFPALFTGLYRRNYEKWLYLVTSADPFPDDNLLSKCKCLIMPGSELSVFDDYDFLRKSEHYIKQIIDNIEKYPNLKILGICFGFQLILKAFDVKLGQIPMKDFIKDPVDLTISDSFWSLNFVKRSHVKPVKTLRIQESHQDYVKTLPDNHKFIKYGSSSSCDMEIIVSKDEKIFLIQGHPEYIPVFMINRGYDFMMELENIESTLENIDKFVTDYIEKPFNQNVNWLELRQLCYTFMKNI